MKITSLILITLIHTSFSVKTKSKNATINKPDDAIKKYLEKHEEVLLEVTKNKSEVVKPVTITNVVNTKIVPVAAKKTKAPPKVIPPDM